jgi:cyclomaltodextrinase
LHDWAAGSVFYHIYPLGLCGAPANNNFYSPVQHRLEYLYYWMDHLQYLGINAVYIGPLFESESHGYDTVDYYHVDRRLGNRETLRKIIDEFHRRGIRVIVDAVFNHVGRKFWAFRDVLEKGGYSWYCDWFQGLTFTKRSPFGDPFTYKTWKGHYSLVKLNLQNKYVKEHLFKAVEMWITELGIDGIRLDAADCLRVKFIRDLAKFTKKLKPDFWLKGEIVHGDYRKKANEKALDSVTNYQLHKELFSSLNHNNYFEIAHSLKWQFAGNGKYKHLELYNFTDNHDLNRAASILKNQAHLYPLYALLFTMPGIPSLYYGSEWGIKGKKIRGSDAQLRPYIDINGGRKNRDLAEAISRFAKIRNYSGALQYGNYTELYVTRQQLAFARQTGNETVIVVINSSSEPVSMEFNVPVSYGHLIDMLNNGERFETYNGRTRINIIWPNWARIMVVKT